MVFPAPPAPGPPEPRDGCALGVPVVRGTAAEAIADDRALVSWAMQRIQQDDYHGLMELVRNGRHDVFSTKQRCSFSMTLRPERCEATSLPRTLNVTSANMLHYAVCIRSFSAAAALVVAHPKLLNGACKVHLNFADDAGGKECTRAETWCAVDLASFFCVLYGNKTFESSDADSETWEDICSTYEIFSTGQRVLEIAHSHPKRIPLLNMPTVEERVAAAGPFAEDAIAAFLAAEEDVCPAAQEEAHGEAEEEEQEDDLEIMLSQRHCERFAKLRAHLTRRDPGPSPEFATGGSGDGRFSSWYGQHMQSAVRLSRDVGTGSSRHGSSDGWLPWP